MKFGKFGYAQDEEREGPHSDPVNFNAVEHRWCCWQELPPASLQELLPARRHHMLFASSDAGRSCRRRGTSACRWYAVPLAGAAAGEAPAHAAGFHRCWQELPPARHHRDLLESVVTGSSCRRRGLSACGLHALLPAGAVAGEAPAQAACIHCCWCGEPHSCCSRRSWVLIPRRISSRWF